MGADRKSVDIFELDRVVGDRVGYGVGGRKRESVVYIGNSRKVPQLHGKQLKSLGVRCGT